MKSSLSTQALITLLLSVAIVFAASAPAPAYDYRKLPKAGFPVLTSPGDGSSNSALPVVNGLHLTEGQDRKPSTGPAQVYNPGEPSQNYALVHWEKAKMPLLIWISPGIMLPDVPFSQLQAQRVEEVHAMLSSSEPFADCTRAPGWTPDTNFQVAAGIEQWRPLQNEGLFSFGFVDDPKEAYIMVFFVDSFKDSTSPGGIMVGGNTCAQIYPIAQAHAMKIGQKPVIIELSTLVNDNPDKMRAAACHEFGHALGIKAHSPYRQDIMYENNVVDQLSPSDKATMRYLYHQTPAWVM